MEELFPVLLAAALGIAISLYTRGALRWVLSCVVVAVSGSAATTSPANWRKTGYTCCRILRKRQSVLRSASPSRVGFCHASVSRAQSRRAKQAGTSHSR